MDFYDPPNLVLDDELPYVECAYKSVRGFNESHIQNDKDTFSIIGMNIRSCRKNFNSFFAFLSMLFIQFSVIVLYETWLMSDIDYGFDIPNYNHVNVYRNNFGGGIKAFYPSNYSVEIINELTFVNGVMEILTFTLKNICNKYIICAIYRPPSADPYHFNEFLHGSILSKFKRDDKVIFIGDFNFNLCNPLRLRYIDDFINTLFEASYFPIITLPSKINEHNPITKYSFIDQIWTNFFVGSEHKSGIFQIPLTDHFPIYYMFKRTLLSVEEIVRFRLINSNTLSNFIEKAANLNFNYVLDINDVNASFNKFYDMLFNTYDTCIPVKRKRCSRKSSAAPWLNDKLRRCIKKKYRLFGLLKRGLILKRDFNRFKNMLTYVMNKSKKLFYMRKLNNCDTTKETWSNINAILRRKTKKNNTLIIKHNNLILNNLDLSDYINNSFIDIACNLADSFPREVDWSYFNNITPNVESFMFFPSSPVEVYNIIGKLANKGNALFDIKPKILNEIKDFIAPLISFFYNKCISQGIYPDILKLSRVVPVYKSGGTNDINNYRPISNLPTINKIFELLTLDRFSSFINRHALITENQFGFRENRSTTTAIFSFVTDVLQTFNKGNYTIAIFMDLKRAFDTVDLSILVYKMNRYGFRGVSNMFFESYLTNRKQYVHVNDVSSEVREISVGVPQGSVLGPQLFNLFINDLSKIEPGKNIFYADDGVFYVTNSCFDQCMSQANALIGKISEWMFKNKLTVNTNKTKLMLFTPHFVNNLPVIRYNGVPLEWVNNFKYLGIILDRNLNFILQSREIVKKLSKLHGMFYSISNILPQSAMIKIFYSLVYPVLTQDIIIWGGIAKSNTCKIKILINKILRIILKVKFNEINIPLVRTGEMYRNLSILQFDDIYRLNILKFLHYSLYKNQTFFNKYFLPLLPTHHYNTRNVRINLPNVRLDIEKHSALYNSCMLMNQIDETFLSQMSDYMLKKKFKDKCISSY